MNHRHKYNAKPVDGLYFEQTNKTGYDESRYMHLVCPVCGTKFHRPPSHVARNKWHTTCSVGCAAEARKVRVESSCVICGKAMELIPSEVIRRTTCSKQCSTLRRIKNIETVSPYRLGGYKAAAKEIAKKQECEKCGIRVGPWVVRNLIAKVTALGETIVDRSRHQLWCRRCYLAELGRQTMRRGGS